MISNCLGCQKWANKTSGLSIKQSLAASFWHQIKHGVYPNFGPLFTPLVYLMYQRGINYAILCCQ